MTRSYSTAGRLVKTQNRETRWYTRLFIHRSIHKLAWHATSCRVFLRRIASMSQGLGCR